MNRFKLAYGGAIILLAALASIAGSALVLWAIGASPWDTYVTIFTGPFKDVFGITEILVRAVPLILVALGIAIAFRSGIINIGAEGQMIVGILASTAVGLVMQLVTPGFETPVDSAYLEYDGNTGAIGPSYRVKHLAGRACPHYPANERGDPLFDVRKLNDAPVAVDQTAVPTPRPLGTWARIKAFFSGH